MSRVGVASGGSFGSNDYSVMFSFLFGSHFSRLVVVFFLRFVVVLHPSVVQRLDLLPHSLRERSSCGDKLYVDGKRLSVEGIGTSCLEPWTKAHRLVRSLPLTDSLDGRSAVRHSCERPVIASGRHPLTSNGKAMGFSTSNHGHFIHEWISIQRCTRPPSPIEKDWIDLEWDGMTGTPRILSYRASRC